MAQPRPRLSNYQNEVVQNLKGKTSMQRWVVLPDVHRPFHNKVLWDKIMTMLNDMGKSLYGVVFLGDYLDAYTVGSYNTDSLYNLRDITLGDEYDDGNKGLDEVDSATHKDIEKHYLYGNHEDRFKRHFQSGDTSKYGSALLDPTRALKLRERGYHVWEDYGEDYITLGEHLDLLHGNYTNKYCAEKHLRMHMGSCMFGHSHIVQTFQKGDKAAYNIGWLGDVNDPVFRYSNADNRKRWTNSFSIVNIDDNGNFYVQVVSVWDNVFFANGKMY